MKEVKNTYWPLILGVIIILMLGIIIGLLINKDKGYIEKNEANSKIEEKKNESIKEDTSDKENTSVKKSEVTKSKTNNNTTSNKNKKQDEIHTPEVVTYSQNDNAVIGTLNNTLSEVNSATNDKSFSKKAKATFISLVDFLFYDGKIKGVTFNELTDSGKQKVLELASKIDASLEKKAPGYKDTISSNTSKAFNKASEVIKNGATNANNFAKEKLGDENYQEIINSKDELVTYTKNAAGFVKDVGSSLFSSAKDKLSKWYQNFKNNN